VAVVGLVVLLPVLAALVLVVVVVDRQRPLVGLARVGQAGRTFTLCKLRTMRPGGAGEAVFTVRDDLRVTDFGRRLRRWRLDELPQLWNVARGDMALLGPRPEAPDYVDLDDDAWQVALTARPGIAGPTQVVIHGWEARLDSTAGYVREVLPRKLEVDGWYVRHASPAIDLEVLRSVLRSVLSPDHATPIHHRLTRELPATMAAITAANPS
jgi:lipopolysaccharide/colanic/teichoic acid biosynthesis glycosyltransferase